MTLRSSLNPSRYSSMHQALAGGIIASGASSTLAYWGGALVVGNVELGSTSRDEISGMEACLNSANAGKFIACDDSGSALYGIGRHGQALGNITLTGATLTDAEDIAIISGTTNRVIIGAFGDNGASRTTKQLFIFDEPTLTTGDITIANDGSWEQVDFIYPASPLWAGGNNRGDAESMFIADSTIYIVSKREAIPKLFSLPIQASYDGTQTLTYEGEIYDIPDGGGTPTVGNWVGGASSHDGFHVVAKTYDQIWEWRRADATTSIFDMLSAAPVEIGYVGQGNHPTAEPQGESICFSADDQVLYHVSETGGGSSATDFPLFALYRSAASSIQTSTLQTGVDSYVGTVDTYIQEGAGETTVHGADTDFLIDSNATPDQSFGLLRFDGLADALGENITIVGAALELDLAASGEEFDLYRITNAAKAWTDASTWDNTGGIVVGTDTPAIPMGGTYGIKTRTGSIQVAIDPSVVQAWYDNASDNLGMLFACAQLDGLRFSSSEASQSLRPKLIIQHNPDPDYVAPTIKSVQQGLDGYANGEDTYWWDSGSGSGTDYSASNTLVSDANVSDDRYAYHKWGGLDSFLPSGATITSVEVDFYVNTEGQGINLHEILSAKTVANSFDDLPANALDRDDVNVTAVAAANWPGADNYTGAITLASSTALVALVQKWYDDDADNHGVLAVAVHASDGQQIDSNESATQDRRPLLRITYTTA